MRILSFPYILPILPRKRRSPTASIVGVAHRSDDPWPSRKVGTRGPICTNRVEGLPIPQIGVGAWPTKKSDRLKLVIPSNRKKSA